MTTPPLHAPLEVIVVVVDADDVAETICDECARQVERYRNALMQADRIPHEQVLCSIELFGKEIIPRVR